MEERVHTKDPAGLRFIEAVRSYVQLLMGRNATPGLNIALADRGTLIWEAAFGFSDLARSRPMSVDSVYHSGSLGKTYTASAVMILVDRGVIALEDPINKHLPFEVHNPLGARDITVHDLMVHKSGLTADGAASFWTPGTSLVEDLRHEYAQPVSPMYAGMTARWSFPVGSLWQYSNLGLATLGLIVETANPEGLSFPDFVQRNVMDPLGMTHSQYPTAQVEDRVRPDIWALATTGYARMGRANIPTLPVYFREFPAGGVLARPADHMRLLLAMMNEGELGGARILSAASAKAMIAPATELKDTEHAKGVLEALDFEQGLIWRLHDWGKPFMSFDHGGGHMFGWRTQGRAWPAYGAAFMVACNQWSQPEDTAETEDLAGFIRNWLRFRGPVDVAEPVAVSAPQLSYARGVFLAAAYRLFIGIPGTPAPEDVDAMVLGTRTDGDDWDPDAFRRGFAAVYALDPTFAALKSFWGLPTCEIDAATARAAYAALGGRIPGMISVVLPDPAA